MNLFIQSDVKLILETILMVDFKILLVVRSIIENDKGEILLMKRKKGRSYNPSKWELPGGKVQNNEDLEDALERIIMDETGLIVKNLGQKHYIHRRFVSEEGKHHGYNYFELALTSEYVTGNPKANSDDHEDNKWAKIRSGKVKLGQEHSSYKWVNQREIMDYDMADFMKLSLTEIFFKRK